MASIALPTASRRHFDRASVGVVACRPVHIDEVLCRDELAVRSVDDEEETVLGRMQDDFARRAIDGDVGSGSSAGPKCSPSYLPEFPDECQICCPVSALSATSEAR